jgi:hypothetical protein
MKSSCHHHSVTPGTPSGIACGATAAARTLHRTVRCRDLRRTPPLDTLGPKFRFRRHVISTDMCCSRVVVSSLRRGAPILWVVWAPPPQLHISFRINPHWVASTTSKRIFKLLTRGLRVGNATAGIVLHPPLQLRRSVVSAANLCQLLRDLRKLLLNVLGVRCWDVPLTATFALRLANCQWSIE